MHVLLNFATLRSQIKAFHHESENKKNQDEDKNIRVKTFKGVPLIAKSSPFFLISFSTSCDDVEIRYVWGIYFILFYSFTRWEAPVVRFNGNTCYYIILRFLGEILGNWILFWMVMDFKCILWGYYHFISIFPMTYFAKAQYYKFYNLFESIMMIED